MLLKAVATEGLKADNRVKGTEQVLDALRGHAFDVAMDIGVATLVENDRLDHLVAGMRKLVRPTATLEVKELYTQGHMPNGTLCHQSGAFMLSYVKRMQQLWTMSKERNFTVGLPDEIRGALLVNNAGSTKQEQLITLTSTANDTSFDKIANALQLQHGKYHVSKYHN